MFIKKSCDEEIATIMGDIICGEDDFRKRFISVLLRIEPEEWKLLEKKVVELAGELQKKRRSSTGNSDGGRY